MGIEPVGQGYVVDGPNLVGVGIDYNNQAPISTRLYPDINYEIRPSVISPEVYKYTTQLLQEAENIANSIRNPKIANVTNETNSSSRSSPRSAGNTYNFSYSPWSFFSPTTTNNTKINNGRSNDRRDNEEKKDNTVLFIFAAITGVCAGIWGIYKLAKSQSEGDNLDRKIGEFEKLQNKWEVHSPSYDSSPKYNARMTKVINLSRTIMQRHKTNTMSSINKVAIPTIVSSGLLIGGALFGSVGVVTLGALGLLVVGGLAIYKSVRNNHSNEDSLDASKILKNIEKLKKDETYLKAYDKFQPQTI